MTRIAISGASGLVGTALSAHLRGRSDDVVHLVRRPARTAAEVSWDPANGRLDPAALAEVDVVVNLSGAGIGDHRWTPSYRRTLLTSRVDPTATIARVLADGAGPRRLVNGSAVGFYGPRGDAVLTEDAPVGSDFLADVVRAWESATEPAARAGVAVTLARTGTMVLSRTGGAMEPLLRLFRLGLGGPMGSGRQFWSWVTLHDEVRALTHLIDRPGLTGPVNLCVPEATRQRDFARELGRALGRPAVLPAPSPALHAVLGEFAGGVLGSQRVRPARLLADGFTFDHPDLASAFAWVLGED